MNRMELKTSARSVLARDHWGIVGVLLIASIVISLAMGVGSALPVAGNTVAWLLVMAPISVGICIYLMKKRAGAGGTLENIFDAYKEGIGNRILTMFLKDLFTTLWTLLFIIPGIYKYYQYFCIPYILAENPEVDHNQAFAYTKEMTNGHKMDLFVLQLSFIGWFILSALTCGILYILYVGPYFQLTMLEAYEDLKQKTYGSNVPFARQQQFIDVDPLH